MCIRQRLQLIRIRGLDKRLVSVTGLPACLADDHAHATDGRVCRLENCCTSCSRPTKICYNTQWSRTNQLYEISQQYQSLALEA